jgi:adenosylcobinamide kinase/adenosylcobinamide-phosphate guanylyltransferase
MKSNIASKKILITGGARSGKSRYALALAQAESVPRIFLATCEPFDQQMKDRIRRHKKERTGDFKTLEEPLYLARALASVPAKTQVVVIDCLTVWLNNLFFHFAKRPSMIDRQQALFLKALKAAPFAVIMVTNEIGCGVIADNALTRSYTDALGRLNQKIAAHSDEVVWMVCGLPQSIKT